MFEFRERCIYASYNSKKLFLFPVTTIYFGMSWQVRKRLLDTYLLHSIYWYGVLFAFHVNSFYLLCCFKLLLDVNIRSHIVHLTIWHQLFLEFWLVHTWYFAHSRSQHIVTRLENVRDLNIRQGKNLGFELSHRKTFRFYPLTISTK